MENARFKRRMISLLVTFYCCITMSTLSLSTNTFSFGENIVLTCTVNGIQTIDINTTRQWSMGDDDKLLCYNGRINNLRKYKEKILTGNAFSLTIFNATETDLNFVYQCRYGFATASKLIEVDEPNIVLSLILKTDVIVFGGDIILTCTANGISTIDSEVTRQWSMRTDDELLCYNGRINNPKKYEETLTSTNQYSLKILNVTDEDVNITYRCRYGFDAASTFIELNKYNYVIPPTQESTTIRYILEKEMDTVNILVYLKRVFPLPNCSLNTNVPNFHIAALREHEVGMDVNLSLSLQKRVACKRSFNISCHVARKQYQVGYLTLKDKCSSQGKFEEIIILSITLIFVGLLIAGLIKSKHLKENSNRKGKNQNNDKTEEDTCSLLSEANISNLCNLKKEHPYESEV